MKAVVFSESAPDVAARAPAHMAEHRARWAEFGGRGELHMIGPYGLAEIGPLIEGVRHVPERSLEP